VLFADQSVGIRDAGNRSGDEYGGQISQHVSDQSKDL
jgi:hypothetical protein